MTNVPETSIADDIVLFGMFYEVSYVKSVIFPDISVAKILFGVVDYILLNGIDESEITDPDIELEVKKSFYILDIWYYPEEFKLNI